MKILMNAGRPAAVLLARVYLGLVITLAFLALAPLLIHWQPTIVSSGSMEPSLRAGDIVVARPVTASNVTDGTVKPGHVLLANDPLKPGTLYTHRVVERLPNGNLITRGDANATRDPARLVPADVKGIEVLRVPYGGFPVLQARQGNLLPAAGIIFLTAAALLLVRDDRRRNPPRRPAMHYLLGLALGERQRTRREARRARKLARGATAATVVLAGTLALSLTGSAAVFSGTTSNAGMHRAAASFPVPAIGAKPLRFGVGEPGDQLNMLDQVAREVNESPSYSQIYRDFKDTFDMPLITATLAKGVTPIVTWEPFDAPAAGTEQPAYKLSTITAGNHDAYLTTVANQLVAAGNPPVYIRFAHEMNGNWYPWGVGVNGNQPGDYQNAWRHVVDLFNAKGLTGVTWVWAPNVAYGPPEELSSLYPGSAYVGLTGLDGFNWGTTQTWSSWARPWDVFSTGLWILEFIAPDKNILIAEVASTETEGANTKAQWIHDAVYYFNHWGDGKSIRIEGFVWFDFNKETNWRIDSSKTSYEAMRDALAWR